MDVERFRKICGLLGSDQVGERAAAAFKATEMLKQNGHSWGAVNVGFVLPPVNYGHMEKYFRMMLDDERAKTKRLTSELDKLKRLAKTLEMKLAEQATGVPVAEQRKAEKAEKKARREERVNEKQRVDQEPEANAAANPRSEMPIDATLREEIKNALEQVLPDRTREFLASVVEQVSWTRKQREAIQKTLHWVSTGRQ
jgi:Skp family chaperone for outer membrane proteins